MTTATTVAVDRLADLAFAEAERHLARTSERRAACHLWTSLITSPTLDAARRAVATFGDPRTQQAAAELLGRITTELTATEGKPS